MKSLYALTQKIREWNQMGLSLLPSLQIAIIHTNQYNHQVIEFLQLLHCKELLYCEKHERNTVKVNQKIQQLQSQQTKETKQQAEVNRIKQEIDKNLSLSQNENQVKNKQFLKGGNFQEKLQKSNKKTTSTLPNWDNRLQDALYAIYLANTQIQARVHLIIDQQTNGKIDDEDFKKLKKTIERLKRNKSVIFLNFNSSVHKFDSMSEHIEQFGLSFKTKQRQIKTDQLIQPQKQIVQKKNNNRIRQNKFNKKDEKQKAIDRQKLSKEKTSKSESKVIQSDVVKQKQITQFESIVKAKLNEFCVFKELNFSQRLMKQIQKKYINLFGVDINKNFNQMKAFHKQLVYELKRYDKFIQLSSINDENVQKVIESNSDTLTKEISLFGHQTKLTKYALNCMHQVIEYLVASLTGTYSTFNVEQNQSSKFGKQASQTRRSIHWETMEIMNEIWDIQGDVLMKQIDKMPVPYIKERYKMLDYQTIGGFMPSSCFHAIFSPPLRKTLQHIFQTLQIIELKILTTTKKVIEYFFDKTNIRYDFSDQQVEQIRKICSKFRKQTQNMLNSQIEFISVSSQDFWTFKQLKSNLYAPDQQAYIEIKYIGKNYVKKVFDNIRETLPRLIGQNLLKQIVFHLQTKSLNGLIQILTQTPIQIQITRSDFDFWEQRKSKQKTIDKLIYYFSLKTNSQTSIKNLKQNLDKSWKRTYKTKQKESKVLDETNEQKNKGFLAWARNLIKGNKKRTQKRSQSQDKKQLNDKSHKQNENQSAQQEVMTKKHHILSEKNWLLILNINKEVEFQKVKRSSQNGFPEKLRPAIWLYLAKKQIKSKTPKVQHLLNQTLNISPEQKVQLDQVFKQIDKDVNRTPPPNLFRKGHLKQSLTRVLRAYSIYDKQLRYTQGMNFICGIILCVLTHYGEKSQYIQSNMKPKMYFQILQNQCYEIFLAMMQNKGLRKIMFIERATITDLCVRLQNYIKERSSIMFEKIQRSGFCVEMIFSGALISGLTTSEINFDLQKRVIDLLITRGFDILYKVIGQFTAASQSLCENMEGENLYFYLKGKFYNDVYNQIGSNGLTKLFNNL